MGTPIAIAVGGALIAAAILLTNHWEFKQTTIIGSVIRLNKWTGNVEHCQLGTGYVYTCGPQ